MCLVIVELAALGKLGQDVVALPTVDFVTHGEITRRDSLDCRGLHLQGEVATLFSFDSSFVDQGEVGTLGMGDDLVMILKAELGGLCSTINVELSVQVNGLARADAPGPVELYWLSSEGRDALSVRVEEIFSHHGFLQSVDLLLIVIADFRELRDLTIDWSNKVLKCEIKRVLIRVG